MTANAVRPGDRGLSPVVGVVLLVGLTVLLGATSATLFLGLSNDNLGQSAPTAKFTFDHTLQSGSDTVTIKHKSGDNVGTNYTYIDLDGARCVGGSDDPDGRYSLADDFRLPGPELKAGMTVQVRPNTDFRGPRELCSDGGDLDLSSASMDIIWEGENSATRTLATWDGP